MLCRPPCIDALGSLAYNASCSTDEHLIFLPERRLCYYLPMYHAIKSAGQQWSSRGFKCQNPSHKHLHITLIQVRRCFSLLGSSTGAPWAPPWVTAAPLALPDVSPGSSVLLRASLIRSQRNSLQHPRGLDVRAFYAKVLPHYRHSSQQAPLRPSRLLFRCALGTFLGHCCTAGTAWCVCTWLHALSRRPCSCSGLCLGTVLWRQNWRHCYHIRLCWHATAAHIDTERWYIYLTWQVSLTIMPMAVPHHNMMASHGALSKWEVFSFAYLGATIW